MKEMDFQLPDWIPQDAWDEWLSWRKSRKFPITPRVLKHCVKMLEIHKNNGYPAELVIDNALVMGWRDLWQPRISNGTRDARTVAGTDEF